MHTHVYAGNNRKSVNLFTQPAAQSASITAPALSGFILIRRRRQQSSVQLSMYRIHSSGSFPGSALWEDILSTLPHCLVLPLSDRGYSVVGCSTSGWWRFCPS